MKTEDEKTESAKLADTVADTETQTLASFLDGELSAADSAKLASRLQEPASGALRIEQQQIEFLGGALRELVATQMKDGLNRPRELNIWEAISAELGSVTDGGGTQTATGSALQIWAQRLKLAVREFSLTPRMYVPAGAMACAVLAMLISRGQNGGDIPPASEIRAFQVAQLEKAQARQGGRKAAEREDDQELPMSRMVRDEQSDQSRTPDVRYVGFGMPSERFGREQLEVVDGYFPLEGAMEMSVFGNGHTGRGFSRLIPHEQLLSRIVQADPVPGGYRLGKVDIDWVRSDSRITIVPVEKNGRPPVIWIGKAIDPPAEKIAGLNDNG